MKVLVTGAAGFIGSKVASELCSRGNEVVCVDNINEYYDVRLKYGRLRQLGIGEDMVYLEWYKSYTSTRFPNLRFIRMGIDEKEALDNLFDIECFDKVVNLAAHVGVRHSIDNPYGYMKSNIEGFLNILEACRYHAVKHLVFASSSSSYGLNKNIPFTEFDFVQTPVTLYAASKICDELMAHSYSCLYGIPTTGLRYFTTYGPWSRPDMAPILFADAITHNKPIKVFNHGDMYRDFTFIDDIAEGTVKVLDCPPKPATSDNGVPYRIYNIGCSTPVKLTDFILTMEAALGKKAKLELLPMQPGDLYMTYADTSRLQKDIGFKPRVKLKEGLRRFADWYMHEWATEKDKSKQKTQGVKNKKQTPYSEMFY